MYLLYNERVFVYRGCLEKFITIMIKRKLCRGDNTGCARYMVSKAVGKEHVPTNLIPNQVDRAEEIISAVKAAKIS